MSDIRIPTRVQRQLQEHASHLGTDPLEALLTALALGLPELAKLITEQIYDNSMIAAGFVEDPRSMVNRIYDLLGRIE